MANRPLRELRLLQGPAGVLSLSEAAKLLPLGNDRAKEWLRKKGLVRNLDGEPVVVWQTVLDAIEDEREKDLDQARGRLATRRPYVPASAKGG